jgi:hypothetical protein
VCGGLAEYFNLDATLIRILFVVLAVLGGSGLVLYLAMWIIAPTNHKACPDCRGPGPACRSAIPVTGWARWTCWQPRSPAATASHPCADPDEVA